MSGDFILKRDWINISRGYLYDAAMFYPSDMERPLEFFIPDTNDENKGVISREIGNFEAIQVGTRWVAIEQKVIFTLKPRKVIVLSNDRLSQTTDYEFVQVAPVMSVHSKDKDRPWYEKMIKDEHPQFVYLPENITGRESYVDVGEITSIHKSLLLKKKMHVGDRLYIVEENILNCLDLGIVDEKHEEGLGLNEKTLEL